MRDEQLKRICGMPYIKDSGITMGGCLAYLNTCSIFHSDDDPNYDSYVIRAAIFFAIAAFGLVWTVCACYECKHFAPSNPECGPCPCVEFLPGFKPDGSAKKRDSSVEMAEAV